MTFLDYWRVLRERWLILLVALGLGLGAATAVYVLRPAEYTATLTMYVSAQGNESTTAAYQGAQLSQQRVTSYVELVSSRRVAEDVVRRLRLTERPEALAAQTSARSGIDSVLIDIAVVDRSPQRAVQLADTVGAVLTDLVDELERPVDPTRPQAVAIRVVQAAALPLAPSSTGLPVLLVLGLLGGLVVGVAAALARDALDTSLTSLEQLRRATDAPNLGLVAHDPDVPRRPLTLQEDPQSPRTEAFRQLRTNLQFVDVDNPRKVIVVTSALPAEGKSTTVVNLAIAMAATGRRVLVIEGDLRRPKVADLLGLDRSAGLTNVLSGGLGVDAVLQRWAERFDVIASGPLPPNPSELLASRHMDRLLVSLRERYDTVLIDSSPLLPVTDAAAVAPATDGAILVCRFRWASQSQVMTAVGHLRSVSASLLGTVFTMVPTSASRAYAQYGRYHASPRPAQPATPPVTEDGVARAQPSTSHASGHR